MYDLLVSGSAQPDVVVRPLTDADREAISTWRYPGELAIYSPGDDAFALEEPDHVALSSSRGELYGYGTIGAEAQVPGGRYDVADGVLDVGLGLRPDLVGAGLGGPAMQAVLAVAGARLAPARFRATVAVANRRAAGLVLRLGFQPTHTFPRPSDGREFVQYERLARHEVDG